MAQFGVSSENSTIDGVTYLSKSGFIPGVSTIGYVINVQNNELVVSLPGGSIGYASAAGISFSDELCGKLVRCDVTERENNKTNKIQLSVLPASVNRSLLENAELAIKKGLQLCGTVSAKEDHG